MSSPNASTARPLNCGDLRAMREAGEKIACLTAYDAPMAALLDPHCDVLLVGGGHNGLTCAAYLARAGLRVTVLERRGVVGGAAVPGSGAIRRATGAVAVSATGAATIPVTRLGQCEDVDALTAL